MGVVTVTELDLSCLTFYLFGSVFGSDRLLCM